MISGISISAITYIFTKMLYSDELYKLEYKLKKAQNEIDNHKYVCVNVKTFPNETTGFKSLIYHSKWITKEEAKNRHDILP